MKNEWEIISSRTSTYRLKVFGGWIVNCVNQSVDAERETSVFVPDVNHEWEIEE